jgi:SAM-dependent methyltransferase
MRCSLCHGFQFEGPTGDLVNLYDENYYNGSEYINYASASEVYRKNFVRKLDLILTHLGNQSLDSIRILEIGCANGEFLRVLADRGIVKSMGIETSNYSRKLAEARGFRVLDPGDPDLLKKIKDFNPTIVCAWDVWEHLPEPAIFFKKLVEAAPAVELLAVSTVDSGAFLPRLRGKNWRQFHPPTHLNYPTKTSFEIYSKNLGFDLVNSSAFGYFRPLADYLSVFLSAKALNRANFLFKIPLYLNLGDILLVVAKRTKPGNISPNS